MSPFTSRVYTFLFIMVCIAGGTGRADAKLSDFLPRYINFSGAVEVEGLYEIDRSSSGSASTETRDLILQETFSLGGIGYIYSPLFIQLLSSASIGLEQERLETENRDYSANQEIYEFRQVMRFLPYHAYNLEIYGERQVGILSGRGGGTASVTTTGYGAKARYDKNPLSASLSYDHQDTESDETVKNDTMTGSLSYFDNLRGLRGTVNYGHNESSRRDSENSADLYGASLSKAFERMILETSWNRNEQEQRSYFLPRDQLTRQVVISELEHEEWENSMEFLLPYNFRSRLAYRQSNRENIQRIGERVSNNYNDSKTYTFHLRHRLYKSLNSSLHARKTTNESRGGTSKQRSFQLTENYSKRLPWGSFSSSLSGGYAELENHGAPITLMESHRLDPGNSFELNSDLVLPESVEVYLIDHNNNDQLIPLSLGVHYSLEERGESLRIIITPPLPEDLLAEPVGLEEDYTYQVDYQLIPADYTLGIENYGAGLQLSLFDRFLNPRYRYNQISQKIVDGTYPGTPGSSKSHVVGIGFLFPPYTLDFTRSWLRSTTNDEDRFTASAEYAREVTDVTRGTISLKYENVKTEEDETGREREISEDIYSAAAQLQSYWPQYSLSSSIDVSYSLYKGTGETERYGLNYNLIWHVGRLDLDLGASYNFSQSEFGGRESDNEYTRIRLMVRREFF